MPKMVVQEEARKEKMIKIKDLTEILLDTDNNWTIIDFHYFDKLIELSNELLSNPDTMKIIKSSKEDFYKYKYIGNNALGLIVRKQKLIQNLIKNKPLKQIIKEENLTGCINIPGKPAMVITGDLIRELFRKRKSYEILRGKNEIEAEEIAQEKVYNSIQGGYNVEEVIRISNHEEIKKRIAKENGIGKSDVLERSELIELIEKGYRKQFNENSFKKYNHWKWIKLLKVIRFGRGTNSFYNKNVSSIYYLIEYLKDNHYKLKDIDKYFGILRISSNEFKEFKSIQNKSLYGETSTNNKGEEITPIIFKTLKAKSEDEILTNLVEMNLWLIATYRALAEINLFAPEGDTLKHRSWELTSNLFILDDKIIIEFKGDINKTVFFTKGGVKIKEGDK